MYKSFPKRERAGWAPSSWETRLSPVLAIPPGNPKIGETPPPPPNPCFTSPGGGSPSSHPAKNLNSCGMGVGKRNWLSRRMGGTLGGDACSSCCPPTPCATRPAPRVYIAAARGARIFRGSGPTPAPLWPREGQGEGAGVGGWRWGGGPQAFGVPRVTSRLILPWVPELQGTPGGMCSLP